MAPVAQYAHELKLMRAAMEEVGFTTITLTQADLAAGSYTLDGNTILLVDALTDFDAVLPPSYPAGKVLTIVLINNTEASIAYGGIAGNITIAPSITHIESVIAFADDGELMPIGYPRRDLPVLIPATATAEDIVNALVSLGFAVDGTPA